jgi:hypothetical protein
MLPQLRLPRRVWAPVLVVVDLWVAAEAISVAANLLAHRALIATAAGRPMSWMPPFVPEWGWLFPVAIFLAIRWCAQHGGSRRECLLVAVLPMVAALLALTAVMVYVSGLRALLVPLGLGSRLVADGQMSIGDLNTAQRALSTAFTAVGSCLGAHWLYLHLAKHGHLAPAPDAPHEPAPSEPNAQPTL